MLFSVMKLLQLTYSNCICIGLLLHPFMVTSSVKWTMLHSSYHLFLMSRIPYLEKLHQGKVMKFWISDEKSPQRNFQKGEIYKKVLVKFCLVTKIFPDELFPNMGAF